MCVCVCVVFFGFSKPFPSFKLSPGFFAEDLNLDNLEGSIEWEHPDEYSKVLAPQLIPSCFSFKTDFQLISSDLFFLLQLNFCSEVYQVKLQDASGGSDLLLRTNLVQENTNVTVQSSRWQCEKEM